MRQKTLAPLSHFLTLCLCTVISFPFAGLMVPTVQFDNGVTTTIGPVEYSYKGPGGDGEILRLQVPLKLAW